MKACDMVENIVKKFGSAVEFEVFGKNALAYVRPVESEDMRQRFPLVDNVPDDIDLWGLFSADGRPLALADDPAALLEDAQDRNLLTVELQ